MKRFLALLFVLLAPVLVRAQAIPASYWGLTVNQHTSFPVQVSYGNFRFWDTGTAQWINLETCAAASGSPTDPCFTWTGLDTETASLKTAGVGEVMYTLSNTPAFAATVTTDPNCNYYAQGAAFHGACYPTTDVASDGTGTDALWKNWVTAIATHANDATYLLTHAHIHSWEIWNEFYRSSVLAGYQATPGSLSFQGTFNQLVRMTEDARCIIKGVGTIHNSPTFGTSTACSATAIDANALIVAPSTTISYAGAIRSLQQFLYCTNSPPATCTNGSAGAAAVDVINGHLYTTDATGPKQPELVAETQIANLNAMLAAGELAKPLWNGEGSWGNTAGNGIYSSDSYGRAGVIPRLFANYWSHGVAVNQWYSYDITSYGGLFNPGSSTLITPESTAWTQTYNWLKGATPSTSPFCVITGTLHVCSLTRQNGVPAQLVWDSQYGPGGTSALTNCTSSATPTICGTTSYNVPGTYRTDWIDILGTVHASTATVTVGAVPILLEGMAGTSSDYYISTSANSPAGSDSNNCTSAATPCLTFAHVESLAGVNDTIHVAANSGVDEYRLSTGNTDSAGLVVPKTGQTFTGPACTPTTGPTLCTPVISGSKILHTAADGTLGSFVVDGSDWKITGQTQSGVFCPNGGSCTVNVTCDTGFTACGYPDDVFLNKVPLTHVLSLGSRPTLTSGQYWFDYTNNIIYIHDDPTSKLVEAAVLKTMFNPNGANNVTVQNLTVEEFATENTLGAIDPNYGNVSQSQSLNWTIQNNYIRLNHSVGVRIAWGEQVLNNVLDTNGVLGFGGGTNSTNNSGVLVKGNTIIDNNYARVNPGQGAGGFKVGATNGATVKNNTVKNNIGHGIHFDVGSGNDLVDGNTVESNIDVLGGGDGIRDEIGQGGGFVVRNNISRFNGSGDSAPGAGQIVSGGSTTSVEAYCNLAEVDNNSATATREEAMSYFASNRGSLNGSYLFSSNNNFHHNTVIWDTGANGEMAFTNSDFTNQPNFLASNVTPDFNQYHASSTGVANFAYSNSSGTPTNVSFAAYQALTGNPDTHGSIDTNNTVGFPTVAITSPIDGTTISTPTTISVTATDTSGISKVEFYVDWVLQNTDTTFPYSWLMNGGTQGAHTIAAMAYSTAGVRLCNAITLTNNIPIVPPVSMGFSFSSNRLGPGSMYTSGTGGASLVGGSTSTNLLTFSPVLALGYQNIPFNLLFRPRGGVKSVYSWSLTGSEPVGVGPINTAGQISGVPTVPGSYVFNVKLSDALGDSFLSPVTVLVNSLSGITLNPSTPTTLIKGATKQLAATGNWSDGRSFMIQPTWSSADSTKVSIDANGNVTAVAVANNILITAQLNGQTATVPFTVIPTIQVVTTTVPNGWINEPYPVSSAVEGAGFALLCAGGDGSPHNGGGPNSFSWQLVSGSLPNGLTLNFLNGLISGTATASGQFSFGVTCTDPVGNVSPTQALVLTIESVTGPMTVTCAITPCSIPSNAQVQMTANLQFSGGPSSVDDVTSGAGATWSSGTPSVATVNQSGLVSGVAAGTSAIQACVGATCGNFTVTVTTAALTSITVSCPTTMSAGTSSFCSAVDQSNKNITASVSWSSSQPTFAQITTGGAITAQVGVAGTTQITASSGTVTSPPVPVSVVTPSAMAILNGCVVNASNLPINCVVPSGWTIVRSQGFESNSLGTNESMDPANVITGVNSHTGAKSMMGTYANDGDKVNWLLGASGTPGPIGSYSEMEISYWELVSPNALYPNSDYYLANIEADSCSPGGQTFGYDAQANVPYTPSTTAEFFLGVSNGSTTNSACQGFWQWNNPSSIPMNAGFWRQVEIHYKPSTTVSGGSDCTALNGGNLCHGNGEAELYINGQLKIQNLQANLNGSQDMTVNPHIEVGGVLHDSCPDGTRAAPFSVCQTSAPTTFQRFIDDIVVVIKPVSVVCTVNCGGGGAGYDGVIKVAIVNGKASLVNSTNQVLHLRGLNAQKQIGYSWDRCNRNDGDPSTVAVEAANIASEGVTAVRMFMDEDCWLNLNGVANGGAPYQAAVQAWVQALHDQHIYTLLDLSSAQPGTVTTLSVPNMGPDADHSIAFWSDVATKFKNDTATMFELFNEPIGGAEDTADWQCLYTQVVNCAIDRNGNRYTSAGLDHLVAAIRTAGATTQPISVPSLHYTHSLGRFLEFVPLIHDSCSVNNGRCLIADDHVYDSAASCVDNACLAARIDSVEAAGYPYLSSEFGEYDCGTSFINRVMPLFDQHNAHYFGYDWGPFLFCNNGLLSLVSQYNPPVPSVTGTALFNHYKGFGGGGGGSPSITITCPSQIQLPNTGTCAATDQNNANITNSVTWTSTNPGTATIDSSGVVHSVAVGTTSIGASNSVAVAKSVLLSVTTTTGCTGQNCTSLLGGKTPGNFTGLSGWLTVAVSDFEGGSNDCLTSICYENGNPGLTGVISHSNGTHSLENDTDGSGYNLRLGVVTAPANEYYISGWRYETPTPTWGADVFIMRVLTTYPNVGSLPNTQDCKFDPQNGVADYISLSAPPNLECEGILNGARPFGQHNAFWGEANDPGSKPAIFNVGQWTQWEAWFRPSSCNGNSMNNDGFFRMFENGVQIVRIDSTTVNQGHIGGCPSMNANALINLEFGGEFTFPAYFLQPTTSDTCIPAGAATCPTCELACRPFSACPVLQQNGHTCYGSQKPWKVYEDDVIFLKR